MIVLDATQPSFWQPPASERRASRSMARLSFTHLMVGHVSTICTGRSGQAMPSYTRSICWSAMAKTSARSLSLSARRAWRIYSRRSKAGIVLNEHVIADGRVFFAHAHSLGAHGIVSKRADAPYRSGRCSAWVECKNSFANAGRQALSGVSPDAVRMRRHRERQRSGMRCVTIDIHEEEIDALVRRGLLDPQRRSRAGALTEAVRRFLDRSLSRSGYA